MTRGTFEFYHTSPDRMKGVANRQLSVAPLGKLFLPSGQLLAGDPFSGLSHEENSWFSVPAGEHGVFLTLAATGEDGHFSLAQRSAYISVVFNPEALSARQEAQRIRLNQGEDPTVFLDRLAPAMVSLPHFSLSEAEAQSRLRAGVPIFSGSIGLTDLEAFERLMPPNIPAEGRGWLERYFDHGLDGSWFDAMDDLISTPMGSANLLLPDATHENIVVTATGWGDGRYQAFIETDENGSPIAFHVDFEIIPFDAMQGLKQTD